jgi:hypothetical protein
MTIPIIFNTYTYTYDYVLISLTTLPYLGYLYIRARKEDSTKGVGIFLSYVRVSRVLMDTFDFVFKTGG